MPRPEPGPVSERLTPMLTSASAAAEATTVGERDQCLAGIFMAMSPVVAGWGKTKMCAMVPLASARRHAQCTVQAEGLGTRFEDVGSGAVVQRLDQGRAVLQHRALVDRALVGDLALVDRGRLGASGAAGRRGWRCRWRLSARSFDDLLEMRLHRRAFQHLLQRGVAAGRPASVRTAASGKISAPTSCRLMPVITASCT